MQPHTSAGGAVIHFENESTVIKNIAALVVGQYTYKKTFLSPRDLMNSGHTCVLSLPSNFIVKLYNTLSNTRSEPGYGLCFSVGYYSMWL